MSKPWRFRKCPSCERVFPAGELRTYDYGEGWSDGRMARTCPRCNWTGMTREFKVVREVHPALISYAPPKLLPLLDPRCEVCGAGMSVARVSPRCGGPRPCKPAPRLLHDGLPIVYPERVSA